MDFRIGLLGVSVLHCMSFTLKPYLCMDRMKPYAYAGIQYVRL